MVSATIRQLVLRVDAIGKGGGARAKNNRFLDSEWLRIESHFLRTDME